MVLSFTIWTALAGKYESSGEVLSYGIAQIPFIWIFGVFYSIGFSGLLVAYTLEVLPFSLRAKGVMIMNITVQAILALSAQTNPLAIKNLPHAWNFWLFYTVSLIRLSDVITDSSSFGIFSKLFGFTLCFQKPKASHSKRLPRSSMVRMQWLMLAWNRLQRRLRFVILRKVMKRMCESNVNDCRADIE